MDQSHGAPSTSEPSSGAPAAVLRRAWLDVAVSTAPQLPDLPALLDARLSELEAAGPVDEPSLLAIAEEASNHALEQGGADVARSLSKRLRRAIYEFLLALDAVHPAELAALATPAPPLPPLPVEAARPAVAFMPEDVSGADDVVSATAVADAPAAAVPMWEAVAPPPPAREVYRVATREMEPLGSAGVDAAGQDAVAEPVQADPAGLADLEDATEAAWGEAYVAEVVDAVEAQVSQAWQQEEEIVAAAPVEADDGAVWTELSGEPQAVVYDTAAADLEEGVAALPFVGDAAPAPEMEPVDVLADADAVVHADAMAEPPVPESNGASHHVTEEPATAGLPDGEMATDAPAGTAGAIAPTEEPVAAAEPNLAAEQPAAPPAQNGHRPRMAPRDLLRVPRQFRRVPPGAEDLQAEAAQASAAHSADVAEPELAEHAADFPAELAPDALAGLPAEPPAVEPTPAWTTPLAATAPEAPAWSAELTPTTEPSDDDLFGVPSVPWGSDRGQQAPAAAVDEDDDVFGIPFSPLAGMRQDSGLPHDAPDLPRPPVVAEEPLYPPPGSSAQEPAPWATPEHDPFAPAHDPYAPQSPPPAATQQPFPPAAHDPYGPYASAHDPYAPAAQPAAPDHAFGPAATASDAFPLAAPPFDPYAASGLPWGSPPALPATPFPIAPREGFHLTDYDATSGDRTMSPQPASPPDDFHLTDPRAFEAHAPASAPAPAENPFPAGVAHPAPAPQVSNAAAAPVPAELHDDLDATGDPHDDNSWRIRQSPRAQLLAERMAQKRREEAARAAFEAASVVNEPERKSKRKRGDDETPDLPTARRLLDEHLRKKRGAEAGALLQRLAQGLGGREIADLALDAGDRCRALGQSRSATNCYLAAWRADPLYETPLWRLSDICLNDQEIDLAVGYLERIAELMRSRGDDEGAIGVYRKIAMIAPERQDVRDVIRLAKTTGRLDG